MVCASLVLSSIGLLMNRQVRDTSWIQGINDLIEEVKPYPVPQTQNGIPLPTSIALNTFYLYENGTKQLIHLSSLSDDEFVSYVMNLIQRINTITYDTIEPDLLEEIESKNRLLNLKLRFPNENDFQQSFSEAYFILDDTLGRDLTGTIIIISNIEREDQISIWEITQ